MINEQQKESNNEKYLILNNSEESDDDDDKNFFLKSKEMQMGNLININNEKKQNEKISEITFLQNKREKTQEANTEINTEINTKLNIEKNIEENRENKSKIKTKNKKKKKKKKTQNKNHKILNGKQICQFYINGACKKGEKCPYSHNVEQIHKKELCKFFLSGNCSKGEKCLYCHNLKEIPCKFYHGRGLCENYDKCPFSHERLNESQINEFIKENEDFLIETKKKYGKTNMDDFLDKFLKNKNSINEFLMIPDFNNDNGLNDINFNYDNNNNFNNNNNINNNINGNYVPIGLTLIAQNPKIMNQVIHKYNEILKSKTNNLNNNNKQNFEDKINMSNEIGNNVNNKVGEEQIKKVKINPFLRPSQISHDDIKNLL